MSEHQQTDNIASNELVKAITATSEFRHADTFSSLVSYLTGNLQNIISSRDYYFNELDAYRNNYITNGLYDIISNDVFVDSGSTDYISITIDKYPEIEQECKRMFSKLNIANLLVSIGPDLFHYGSYNLRPILRPGRGIVDIVDDLDPRAVITITDSKNIALMHFVSNNYLSKRSIDPVTGNLNIQPSMQYSNSKQQYEYLSITELLNFSTDLGFIKLALPPRVSQQLRAKAPSFHRKLLPTALKVRTPQSLIWPAVDKLKEVLLLDKLSVFRDIGSILTPNLIGIPVPDAYDPEQLINIVKKYDDLLNSNVVKLNNTQSLEVTLQELASVKVVPIVGDRSTPSPIDTGRSQPTSNPEAIKNSLNRLLSTLGVPIELFDGQMEDKTNIKNNIRYAKKIKRIQKNIIRSLTMMCLLHISQKYPDKNVGFSDINIQLRNNINIDELENLEAQDLLIASINSLEGLLTTIEPIVDKSDYEIDHNLIVENIKDSFSALGSKYSSILRKKDPNKKPTVGGEVPSDSTTPPTPE